MPKRIGSRIDRESGPKPFSRDWVAAGEPTPVERPLLHLPDWAPSAHTLTAALVLLLALAASVATIRGGSSPDGAWPPASMASPAAVMAAPSPAADAAQAPILITPQIAAETATPPTPTPGAAVLPGSLLPGSRVLAFYGHPHDANMGIVGEMPREELLARLLALKAEYEAVDPSRPVIPAIELIATVAQRTPGSDGSYVLDTDTATLAAYADFAAANGAIVILDIQMGRATVPIEFEKVRELLKRPNVHLAIDPEFSMAEGQIPGEVIGSIDATEIAWAQAQLAQMVAEFGLPPKILVVHQFEENMIRNKMTLVPVPGVQLVIDADGYGVPELKIAVFNFLVRDEPLEFAGIKLFYRQDDPLMTPAEVLALTPSPDVIIYQ